MNRCIQCQAPLAPGSKFCTSCGSPVTQGVPSSAPQATHRCPTCGSSISPGVKFCTHCGGALKDLETKVPSQKKALRPRRAFLKWNQRIWDIIAVVGGLAMALVWYIYTGLPGGEGVDKKTCYAMAILPIGLIILRPLTDRILMPLQVIKRKIPPIVILGVGLAVPFVVSNVLYGKGIKEYPFMFKTFVISALISYAVLRIPSRRGRSN
jgi:hypothetical protein